MTTKNFKIVTLGASGAGKTVFLASLFKRLFEQESAQFNLKIEDPTQRKKLNSIYTQLINGEKWPEGTRGYSEWTFTCRVQTEDLTHYNACQFTYFDYAGDRLTDEELEPEFLDMMNQTDAILGLLDGHKLYNWLSNQESAKVAEFLEIDLPRILDCMQYSKAPIQFVISKWDVLESQFELATVRDRLLTIPQFKQVVQDRQRVGSIVRLIPISAVGSGFAQLKGDVMQRVPGAIPMPELVEVPLACVLPDQLKFQLHQLQQQEKLKQTNTRFFDIAGNVLTATGTVLGFASELIGVFSGNPLLYILAEGAAGLSGRVGVSIQENAEERALLRETSLKQVRDEKSALRHAMDSFLQIQQEFVDSYPDSEVVVN